MKGQAREWASETDQGPQMNKTDDYTSTKGKNGKSGRGKKGGDWASATGQRPQDNKTDQIKGKKGMNGKSGGSKGGGKGRGKRG